MRGKSLLAFVFSAIAWSVWADYSVGQRALRRGDLQAAYEGFKEAAEAGDAEAAKRLGLMLGRGIEIHGGQKLAARPEEAAKWHRVAADLGDPVSADILGAMLAVGRGVPRDPEEALRRFKQAGRETEDTLKWVERYPEADRVEIAAWFLAIYAAKDHEVKRLRPVGQSGDVVVEIRTNPPGVAVHEGAPPILADYVTEFCKEILELASPPPAARRAKVSQQLTFRFH